MAEHDDIIRKEVEKQKDIAIEEINRKNEGVKQSLISQIKEKDSLLSQQETKMVDNKIETAINGKVDKCLQKGKWIEDYYNRILISMIAILFVIFLIVFFVFKSKIPLTEGVFGLIIAIADVIIGGILTVIINAFKEYYTNSERLYTKYRRKLMKKYKDLL